MAETIDLSEGPFDVSESRYPGQGDWVPIGPHLSVAKIEGGYVLRHPCLSGQKGDPNRTRLIHASRVVGWTIVTLEPLLTLQPSIHCLGCGLHGFIRAGKWEDCGGGLAWTPA